MANGSTLDKIQEKGVLNVGFQRHTPPFSYCTNDVLNPVGYSVDLFHHVLCGLKKTLRIDEILFKPVEVTSATRLELLQQGRIDIECGSTSLTPDRQRSNLFSRPIFLTGHKLLLKPGVDVFPSTKEADLTVVGIQNSTSHTSFLNSHSTFPQFRFSGCRDIGSSFERFQKDDNVVGMVADEVILRSLMAQATIPETNLHPVPGATEAYGFMIRLGDSHFRRLVDRELDALLASGAWEALHARWFSESLSGIRFNLDKA